MKKQYRSYAFATPHETVYDLHDTGAVDVHTLSKFDKDVPGTGHHQGAASYPVFAVSFSVASSISMAPEAAFTAIT